jgi:hypothetical protein
MDTYNVIPLRNADFIRVFKKVVAQFPNISTEDAVIIAIHSPAQEFYISEEKALRYCYNIHNRRPTGIKRGTAKYLCVTTLYYTARQKSRDMNISLRNAIIDVIYSTAPRFYINRSTAYNIIKDIRTK